MNLVRRRSLQTTAEIGDLRDCLLGLSREKLTTKQFHLVSSKSSVEESLLVDPSIRFFGAEWNSLTGRWMETVKNIKLIIESFDTKSSDINKLNIVLSDLSRLETEISLHTEAVLSGRLNEDQQRQQFLQQQQFLRVPGDMRTRSKDRGSRKSSRETTSRKSPSPSPSSSIPVLRCRSMKEKHNKEKKFTGIKRSKTTDLSQKISQHSLTVDTAIARSRSQDGDIDIDSLLEGKKSGDGRRKSSFVEHISNLLRSIL